MRPLGQALGFIKLVASLGGGAIMVWVVWQVGYPLLDDAKAAAPGGYGGLIANDWIRTGMEVLPILFLALAFFGFIALAVYQREVVR